MLQRRRLLGTPLLAAATLSLALLADTPAGAQPTPRTRAPLVRPPIPPAPAQPGGTAQPAQPTLPPEVTPPEPKKTSTSREAKHKDRVDQLMNVAAGLQRACPADRRGVALFTEVREAHAAALAPPADAKKSADKVKAPKGKPALDAATAQAVERRARDHAALCDALCSDQGTVNVCALRAIVPANAAVAADWPSLSLLLERIDTTAQEAGLRNLPPTSPSRALADVGKAAGDVLKSRGEQGEAMLGLESFASSFLPLAFSGLAKLIEDRAKQEAMGWALTRVGSDVCGSDEKYKDDPLPYAEIRGYWFPSLCRLASSNRLYEYGAGNVLLKTFRASLSEDFTAWPGTGAGLAVGLGFWEEAKKNAGLTPDQVKLARKHPVEEAKSLDLSLFVCGDVDPAAKAPGAKPVLDACAALGKVRRATGKQVTTMLSGTNPWTALGQLSGEIDDANRWTKSGKAALYSPATQVAACLAALPQAFQDLQPKVHLSIQDDAQAARATALAAFATIPACWTIVGRGFPVDACNTGNWASGGACAAETALEQPSGLERLSTVIRLEKTIGVKVQAVANQWSVVDAAYKAYQKAVEDAAKTLADAKIESPNLGNTKLDQPAAVGEAVKAFVGGMLEAASAKARALHLNGALTLAESSVALARAGDELLLSAKPELFPGLTSTTWVEKDAAGKPTGRWTVDGTERVKQVDSTLATVADMLAGVRALASQDWATASTRVLDGLHRATASSHGEVVVVIDAASRHTAAVVAILSAKDGDQMAQALNAVANPPGGWRVKSEPRTVTISLTAHPGVFIGGEKRWGPYGAYLERGGETYFQAPALSMPVGLELAFGCDVAWPRPFAIFIPVLDPLAFLNYDASKGRLPGPSLKTVLSPGLGLRLGFQNTPFSIMPMAVYRPGLRLWKPELAGNGADAFQFGVLFSVDVTLFDIVNRSTH